MLLCRCKLEKDEDSEECIFYKRCYESICPDEWVRRSISLSLFDDGVYRQSQIERWEELREEGLWAGRY